MPSTLTRENIPFKLWEVWGWGQIQSSDQIDLQLTTYNLQECSCDIMLTQLTKNEVSHIERDAMPSFTFLDTPPMPNIVFLMDNFDS